MDEENLQLLCPNCHSLTETFGNLNKKVKEFLEDKKKIYKISCIRLEVGHKIF